MIVKTDRVLNIANFNTFNNIVESDSAFYITMFRISA